MEGTCKPLRDGALVQHYGLDGSHFLRLATSTDGCLLGGAGESPDLDTLIAIRNSNTSIAKLSGWDDLETHRDAGQCEGIKLNSDGRVIKLNLANKNLTGNGYIYQSIRNEEYYECIGSIPSQLGNLTVLGTLNLRRSKLTGLLKFLVRLYQ